MAIPNLTGGAGGPAVSSGLSDGFATNKWGGFTQVKIDTSPFMVLAAIVGVYFVWKMLKSK